MTEPDHGVPTASELQRAIASVTGVTAAEVTPTSAGRDRLRISLAPGEDSEAVAWAVAATLRERFGIALDPAAITARVVTAPGTTTPDLTAHGTAAPGVTPFDTTPPAPTPSHTTPEPAETAPAEDVDETIEGASQEHVAGPQDVTAPTLLPAADVMAAAQASLPPEGVTVGPARPRRRRAAIRELIARPVGDDDLDVVATLGLSGREATGRVRGLRTRHGRWRAIAEATLAALDTLSVGRVRAHVDHVTVLAFTDLAHVSVSITMLTERGEETFLGAALVRDDPDGAVMRAALDAVNRRVEPWLADAGAGARVDAS